MASHLKRQVSDFLAMRGASRQQRENASVLDERLGEQLVRCGVVGDREVEDRVARGGVPILLQALPVRVAGVDGWGVSVRGLRCGDRVRPPKKRSLSEVPKLAHPKKRSLSEVPKFADPKKRSLSEVRKFADPKKRSLSEVPKFADPKK
jgi:hypothetical protein